MMIPMQSLNMTASQSFGSTSLLFSDVEAAPQII